MLKFQSPLVTEGRKYNKLQTFWYGQMGEKQWAALYAHALCTHNGMQNQARLKNWDGHLVSYGMEEMSSTRLANMVRHH